MPETSLFDFMRSEGWTTLEIMHDASSGKIALRGAMEWLESADWSMYGEHDLVTTMEWWETEGVLPRIEKSPARSQFDRVVDLIRHGRHERLELLYDWKQDIRFISAIHSTKTGPPAGGIRRHPMEDPEIEVIADILNLSRGMSFKNAAAGIPNGGCKFGVHTSLPESERDDRFYGFIATCIDRSNAFTGPDMGFSLEDANRIRKFTRNIVGGTAKTGSGGATGQTAAWGVFLGMNVAIAEAGWESPKGLRIAVQGTGELGRPLIGFLRKEGAHIIAADISDEALSGLDVVKVAPEEILTAPCDILSPCAVGGVLTPETIVNLDCKMVCGGANNQLASTSVEDEYLMARLLMQRNITFVPDWIVNAGGVIQGKMEHVRRDKFKIEDAMAEAEHIVPRNTRSVLRLAKREGITPVEAAYKKFAYTVYGTVE